MTIYYVAMAAAVLALLFALFSAISIAKKPVGGERMREISTYIHDGAMAFIKREYMIISIFMVLLFALIWIFINVYTAICFLCGAACSMLAGFVGMKVATFGQCALCQRGAEFHNQRPESGLFRRLGYGHVGGGPGAFGPFGLLGYF